MTYPNTLIFVDFPSDDPEASGKFYAEVFGWEVEPRPAVMPCEREQVVEVNGSVEVGVAG